MNSKRYIRKRLIENSDTIRKLGIRRLGIFGSVARGTQNDNSDIDFIVEFEDGRKNFRSFNKLYDILEQLFTQKIELITPESLQTFMREKILEETEYVL